MSNLSDEELKVIYEKTKGIMHITQHKRFWDYFNLLKEESSLVEKQQNKIVTLEKQIKLMQKDDRISKDKIRETIKDLEKHKIMSSDEFTIKVLKDLLKE